MEPLRSNALVKAKKFTNGADKEDIVLPKDAKTFSAVIANAEALGLVGMGFGDEQALLSGEAAEVCDYLEFPLRRMAGAGVAPWSRCASIRLSRQRSSQMVPTKRISGSVSMERPSPQPSLRRALSLVGMGFGDEHAKEVLEVAGRFART